MRRHGQLLTLALALGACVGSPRPEAEDAPPQDEPRANSRDAEVRAAPPDSVRDRFVRHGLRPIGSSREEIAATLGEPDRVEVEPVANRHDPTRMDSIFDLHYDGLTATVYHVTGGSDLLSEVRVTDNRHLRDPAVRIGDSWTEVRARLGAPQESAGARHRYECGSCIGAENPAFIHVRDGIVTAVEFTYYVD